MKAYFREIYTGGKSLLIGLGVTFRQCLNPVVTVQYPREKIEVTPNIRGHIQLLTDPESGLPKCVACLMCMKNCPSACIEVKGEKREGAKGKFPILFKLDFTKCSLCGICIDSCNFNAIEFSNEYELAGFSRDDFYFDLLKRSEEST